jgi:hypothetical protein
LFLSLFDFFLIDATTIDLCLSTFHRASFCSTKAGIKLHTQLDLKTSIPECILFSNASVHDVNALDVINLEPDSICVLDKGSIDYRRLYRIHLSGAFFIIRPKENMNFRRLYSRPEEKVKGVRCDQIIMLNNYYAAKDYSEKLRRIKFCDGEGGQVLIFLTNNFHLIATDTANLCKHRRKIEPFLELD